MSFDRIGDIDIYYEVSGEGEAVLLLHGLGSSSKDWEYQVDALSQHYRVIVVDIRGHGQTSKAKGRYSIELFAHDIADLMERLQIDLFHIVGLSMGGMLAFQLALDIPERVKSITVVNSGPGFVSTSRKLKLVFAIRLLALRLFGLKAVAPKIAEGLFPKGSNPTLANTFIERFNNNDKSSYIKSMKALLKWSVLSQIESINCPALIITADRDYTSIASKKSYVTKMPKAKLVVIENSHHALPVEKPEKFNLIVIDFLKNA